MDEVRQWLARLNLQRYYDGFIENGYDDLDAVNCLDDEDLDAIGVTDPKHRQAIKTQSTQQQAPPLQEQVIPEDDPGADIDDVLSDLDSIIGELGAFGAPSQAPPTKPKVAPKPTKPAPAPKPAMTVTPVKTSRTSSVFVETESGQKTIAQDTPDDFDLDSLLYDIVKFDPNKIVQQSQQQKSAPPPVAGRGGADQPDGGATPTTPSAVREPLLSNSETSLEGTKETIVKPDLRSASVMISEEEVRQRLNKLEQDLSSDATMTKEEVEQKLKAEKMRIALEKMKLANIKKAAVKVFNDDSSSKTVVVEEGMSSAMVCHLLVVKNLVEENPLWGLVEKWDEMGIERVLEDHEIVIDVYSTWPRLNSNTFTFKKLERKYDLFENPMRYFPSHLSVGGESAYKHGAQERAEKAKKILLQEYFSSTHRVPEVEGILYSKEGYKKPWKKFFFILRSSGLYYSIKGKSKLSKNLKVFVHFEEHNVYHGVGLKKMLTAPSEYCFCLKPTGSANLVRDNTKVLCAESEQILDTWVAGIRLAKYGLQLKENYHKSHVTQFKLEDVEAGTQVAQERQQKLTGNIVENHLDKVRAEYQRQQEEHIKPPPVPAGMHPAVPNDRLADRPPPLPSERIPSLSGSRPPVSTDRFPSVSGNKPPVSTDRFSSVSGNKPPASNERLPSFTSPSPSIPNGGHTTMSDNQPPPIPVNILTSSPKHQARPHVPVPVRQSPAPVPTFSPPHPFSGPPPLTAFSWYHGDISRDIAVRRLEEFSMMDGVFLIRQSKSCVGTYVLTMAAEGVIRNFQIQPHSRPVTGEVVYKIDDGPEFSSISEMLEHYKGDADRLPCRLTQFCPK